MGFLKENNKDKKIHLIGVGGVSMSGIAALLFKEGYHVTGSDDSTSKYTEKLKSMGMKINHGANLEDVENADVIIYTVAIPSDHPEFKKAKELNKMIIERSDFMSDFTEKFDECIGISGTHGKTTTTSMTSLCFLEANLDPSIHVGAYLKNIDSNYRVGQSPYLIIESCEYKDHFLKFNPDTIAILNIDLDHVDYFNDIEDVKKSFKAFIDRNRKNGKIIVNGDDENIKDILLRNKFNQKIITFGENSQNDFYYNNVKIEKTDDKIYQSFDVFNKGNLLGNIKIKVYGKHNILNALCATVISIMYNIDFNIIKKALLKFEGASRRFEYKGQINGFSIYDDYAHHPNEIKALSESVKYIKENESWAIFEPHTYSRISKFLEQFVDSLSGFDNIIIAPIYAARKEEGYNITEENIKEEILKKYSNKKVYFLGEYKNIAKFILENAKEKDIVISIGAGNVTKLYEYLLKEKG